MSKVLGLFPGQGSQKVGMGRELFDGSNLAREYFETADRLLKFPLSSICFDGPHEKLTETAVAQPAILTMSIICFELAAPGVPLGAAAGHSLGEYSALVAARAISFSDAVQLVHKRGRYMQEAVPQGRGKMVAVLGKDLPELEDALAKVQGGVAEIANINAPGQIVISGDAEGVDEFSRIMAGAKIIPLAVSAPFHCSLMAPAAEALKKDLEAITINKAAFPVYANYSALPLQEPEMIRSALELQVCGRVRWIECMQNAIRDIAPKRAVEFGLGSTLAGMLKRIDASIDRCTAGSLSEIAGLIGAA